MLINTYNFWNTYLGPIAESSNLSGAHAPHTVVGTEPTCAHLHPRQLWAAENPSSVWGGQVTSFLFSLPRLMWALQPTMCPCCSPYSASDCRGWWDSPHGPRCPGVGGPTCCPMLSAPGWTRCPLGVLLHHGDAALQGFSPSTTTLRATFIFLFRLTPPLFQKSLCGHLSEDISPK